MKPIPCVVEGQSKKTLFSGDFIEALQWQHKRCPEPATCYRIPDRKILARFAGNRNLVSEEDFQALFHKSTQEEDDEECGNPDLEDENGRDLDPMTWEKLIKKWCKNETDGATNEKHDAVPVLGEPDGNNEF